MTDLTFYHYATQITLTVDLDKPHHRLLSDMLANQGSTRARILSAAAAVRDSVAYIIDCAQDDRGRMPGGIGSLDTLESELRVYQQTQLAIDTLTRAIITEGALVRAA